MIATDELVICARVIELLHYGVDVTKLDTYKQYYNPKSKSVISRLTENVPDFLFKISNETAEFLQWPLGNYFKREGNKFFSIFEDKLTDAERAMVSCEIDLLTFKQIMMVCSTKTWCCFSEYKPSDYDPEYETRVKKMREEWDYTDTSDCELVKDLAKDKIEDNFHALLTLCEYTEERSKELVEQFNNPETDFEIKGLEEFKPIDGRIYIKLLPFDLENIRRKCDSSYARDIKYLVISRNPYDYFFCSYGSEFQSCYALNSGHYGWYGMVGMAGCKGNFIVYLSSGKANKINIINGKKWNVPRMLLRCWGWLAEDGRLLLDRPYCHDNIHNIERELYEYICSTFLGYSGNDLWQTQRVPLKYSAQLVETWNKTRYHMYPDSVKVEDFYYRGICHGDRAFVGQCEPFRENFLSRMNRIETVPVGFRYKTSQYDIVNGVLTVKKICPITGLPIVETESVSFYAKFFKEPIKKLAVFTYCDGFYKLDASYTKRLESATSNIRIYGEDLTCLSSRDGSMFKFTPMFCSASNRIAIKSFKELITGAVKKSPLDYAIVRYIEEDRVTYVKYKGN